MTKEVMIRISGLHASVDTQSDSEKLEVIAPALFYEKGDKYYVLYEEMDESGNALVKNTIKITPHKSLEMIKNGSVTSHMFFEVGHTTNNAYQTQFGEFNLGVTANSLDMQLEEELITVDMNYSLSVNYELMSNCDLSLRIMPRNRDTVRLDPGFSGK